MKMRDVEAHVYTQKAGTVLLGESGKVATCRYFVALSGTKRCETV